MAQPSAVLDAVVAGIDAELRAIFLGLEGPPVYVRAIDDAAEDILGSTTVPTGSVFVSITDMPTSEYSFDAGALVVDAQFVARCYAQLPGSNQAAATRGDLAMNLAAAVASVVHQADWIDGEGVPLVRRAPEQLALRNRSTAALRERGMTLWLVTWTQLLELTARDIAASLHALRRLHGSFAVGADGAVGVELPLQGGSP